MPDVDIATVYEEVSIAEDITIGFVNFVSVYSGVNIAEDCSLGFFYTVNKYDSVVVSESVSASIVSHWHLRSSAKIPIQLLSASFATALQLDSRLPTWAFIGQAGSQLTKRLPTHELSGTMKESTIGFNAGSKLSVGTISGSFGSQLIKKLPTWEISSILLSDYFTLGRKIPIPSLSASMYEQGVWALDKNIPPRTFVGSLDITDELLVVDSKIPGSFKLTASMYSNDTWQLEESIAIRELVASLYSGGMALEDEISLLVLSAVMHETTPEGDKNASVTDTYFDGVLRYIRP